MIGIDQTSSLLKNSDIGAGFSMHCIQDRQNKIWIAVSAICVNLRSR